jgi:hypothetical protein
MPENRIAELLLASVTAPDRAKSIVGDLRESAATRGELWFWASVVRTTASLSWHGITAGPRRMFGLAFRGLLLAFLTQVWFVGAASMAVLAYRSLTSQTTGTGVVAGGLSAWNLMGWMWADFYVGRWMARRAPGRELSAWLALSMLQFVIMSAIVLALGSRNWVGNGGGLLLMTLTCFLGSLSQRRFTRYARP